MLKLSLTKMGVLVFIVGLWTSAGAQSTSVLGRYAGTVGGTLIQLELKAGGVAIVAGEPGRWAARDNAIEVSDGDGNIYAGHISTDAIDFVVEQQTIRFSRKPAASSVELPKYEPTRLPAGKRVKVEGTELSLVLPKGWHGAWETLEGTEVFAIKSSAKDASILASARELSALEQKKPLSSLLVGWAPGLAQGTQVERARDVSIRGHAAAIAVVDSTDKRKARVAVGAVRMGDWAIVFLALYPSTSDKQMRPVFDQVITSLDGKAPTAATVKTSGASGATYAHCWRSLTSSGSGGGSSTQVTLASDQSYQWRSSSSFGSMGGSVNNEAGSWLMVDATHIKLTPNDGSEVVTYSVSMSGSGMLLNGDKFYRCD